MAYLVLAAAHFVAAIAIAIHGTDHSLALAQLGGAVGVAGIGILETYLENRHAR